MKQKNTNYIAIPTLLKVEKGALSKIGFYLKAFNLNKGNSSAGGIHKVPEYTN